MLHNSQDGTFCFDTSRQQILDINTKCARWLRYERAELIGKNLAVIWPDQLERDRIISAMKTGRDYPENEALFRGKDGTILRFVISAVLVTKDRILCSVVDITGSKIIDEEIRRTLDDLEEQVKQRTEHLERINEALRAEILQRRGYENTLPSERHRHPPEEKER
jgi:PAS domain S-box-containing protein